MKKVLCAFIVIIFSFLLSCCGKERLTKEEVKGEPLSDGTGTYYVNEYNDRKEKVRASRYSENKELLEQSEFEYSYDINGRLISKKETNTLNNESKQTVFDKNGNLSEISFYDSSHIIKSKKEYLNNGNVKKEYIFANGNKTGYILYDYYSDNQVKNKTQYGNEDKIVQSTTYYKNNLLYQIKDYDSSGFISRITKYSYNGDKLVKESYYDADFNLTETVDYTKNPPEKIKYDKNNAVKN